MGSLDFLLEDDDEEFRHSHKHPVKKEQSFSSHDLEDESSHENFDFLDDEEFRHSHDNLFEEEDEEELSHGIFDFFEDDRPADPMDGWDTYGKKKKSIFDIEDWRSVSESRRYRAQGLGNWSSHEDWSCGEHEDHPDNYLEGWDSYEDNTI